MTVAIDFTSDPKAVLKALDRMHAQTEKLVAQNKKLREESKKGGKQGEVSFLAMTKGALAAAGAAGLVTKALRLGNDALREQVRLQEKSRSTKLSLAESEQAIAINIGLGVSAKETEAFKADLKAIRRETQFQSQAAVNFAGSSLLSATVGNQALAKDVVRQSIPFFRNNPEALAGFAGSVADTAINTGLSAQESLGLNLAVQGSSRFTKLGGLEKFGTLISNARITAGKGSELQSVREGLALAAAISGSAVDVEGSITTTAGSNLLTNLAAAVPGKATPFARLQEVRKSAELQAEVLKSGFKGSIKPTIRELVTGTGGLTGQAARDIFPTLDPSRESVEAKALAIQTGSPVLRAAARQARLKGTIEAFEAGDAGGGATARDILQAGLQRTRIGPIAGAIGFAQDAAALVEGPTTGRMRQLQEELRRARGGAAVGFGTARDDRTIEFLEELVQQMRDLNSKVPTTTTSSQVDQ